MPGRLNSFTTMILKWQAIGKILGEDEERRSCSNDAGIGLDVSPARTQIIFKSVRLKLGLEFFTCEHNFSYIAYILERMKENI